MKQKRIIFELLASGLNAWLTMAACGHCVKLVALWIHISIYLKILRVDKLLVSISLIHTLICYRKECAEDGLDSQTLAH